MFARLTDTLQPSLTLTAADHDYAEYLKRRLPPLQGQRRVSSSSMTDAERAARRQKDDFARHAREQLKRDNAVFSQTSPNAHSKAGVNSCQPSNPDCQQQ